MKKLLLMTPLLLLTACDPIEGFIQLQQRLDYVTKKSSVGCNGEAWQPECDIPKNQSIPAGNYSVQIDQTSKWSVAIRIDEGKRRHEISLDTGKKQIPLDGEFRLSAQESGQPFDVLANLKTNFQNSPEYFDNLSCEVERNRREDCYLLPGGGPRPIRRCVTTIDIYRGDRDIRYYNRTTATRLNGTLKRQALKLADLTGSRTSVDRITTYDSGCKNLYYSGTRQETHDYRP